MLDSLAIATDGYASRTVKKALIIAVAGYLNYTDVPPNTGGAGGRVNQKHETYDNSKELKERKRKIEASDSEIIEIVKITLTNFII